MKQRKEKKKELEETVKVASIELPKFEYHILSEDNNNNSIDFMDTNTNDNEITNNYISSFDNISSNDDNILNVDNNNSWLSLFNSNIEEENKKEKEKRRLELLKEKEKRKQEEIKQKQEQKRLKKIQIRKNIQKNAKYGREQQRIRNIQKQKEKEEKLGKIQQEKLEKQLIWEKEQQKRKEEWEIKKKQLREERKQKKMKFKEQKERILQEEVKEKGRKLFIGKIEFNDIKNHESLNEFKKEELIDLRKEKFISLLTKFGSIDNIKEFWDKNYIFVVYDTIESAENAFLYLSDYVNRKQESATIRKSLKQSLLDVHIAPLPTYYIRWPRNRN